MKLSSKEMQWNYKVGLVIKVGNEGRRGYEFNCPLTFGKYKVDLKDLEVGGRGFVFNSLH